MLRYVTDEIMAAVQEQSGQEYVDAYGASVKAALADGRELASAVVVARPGLGRPVPPVPEHRPRPTQPHRSPADPDARRDGRGRDHVSDPARDAEKAARKAAKDAEKRARAVAKSGPLGAPQGQKLAGRPAGGRRTSDSSEGRGLYWVMRSVLLGPPVKQDLLPDRGGRARTCRRRVAAILAANHLSFSDWVFMPLALDRRITFVAKSDYFTGEGVKGWAQRRFFAGTGQVPIDRSGGRASEAALRAGMKVLERGDLFGIFPEGTRSHDGRLYKGRTGVARMALEAQVPVIPVAMIGTDVIAPPGKVLSKVMSPTVKFGTPLDFSRYEGMSEDRFILRSVTDEIMYAIMELSGQEYVDLYASSAKELAAKQAKQDEADEVSPQA